MSKSLKKFYMNMLIGHEHIIKYFNNLVEKDRLAHAYAFSGPEGVGKRTLVLNIAQNIFCPETGALNHKRDVCVICVSITRGDHPNVTTIKVDKEGVKKNIAIEQIRQLRKKLILKEMTGRKRIIIIDGAEFMNTEAANAFLKTLEEPFSDINFFLITNSISSLLATIASRVQSVRFNVVSDGKIEKALVAKGVETKPAKEYASLAYGCPGAAIAMAQDKDLYAATKEVNRTVKYFISDFISERLKLPVILSEDPQKAVLQINKWLLALDGLMKEQLQKDDPRVKLTANSIGKLLKLAELGKNTNINIRLALEQIIFDRAENKI